MNDPPTNKNIRDIVLLQLLPHTKWTNRAVYIQSFFVCGSFFWIPALALYILKKYKTSRERAYTLAAFIIALAVPVQRSRFVQNLSFWDKLFRYFSLKVKGVSFDQTKQTVFGIIPHGIVPLTLGLTAYGQLNKLFNNLRIITATATRLVPVFSHVLRLGGSIDASAVYVDAALQQGESIGVTPGGIAEMYWGYPQPGCLPNEEYAVLKQRKGFIRMAMKHGANVIPVYVFGGSKIYKRIVVPKFIERLSRAIRLSLILFFGKWGLPIPLQVPLLYAVGASIQTFKTLNPPPEEVDFVHNIFCAELKRVFDSYKSEYGWSKKILRIV